MESFFDIFSWIVIGFIGLVFLVIVVGLATGRGRRSRRRSAGSDFGGSDSSAWSSDTSSGSCDSGGWSDSGGSSDGGGCGGGGD